MTPQAGNRWLIVVPPTVVTFCVCLIGIGSTDPWKDEYITWYASTLSFGDLFRLLDHVDTLIGPYYLGMHGWLAIVGDGAGLMRVQSAVAMACAAGLVALIGRRLFDPGVGLCAGLVFAALPVVSVYGQEARPYAFAIAAVLLATLLLLRAIDLPSRRRWTWYGCALAAVGLMHVVALTVLLAHAVLLGWEARHGRGDLPRRWLVAAAVPVLALLPLVAKGSTQMASIDWIKGGGRAVKAFPGHLFGTPTVALVVIVLALAAVVAMGSKDRRAAVLLVSWAVIPPVFCYATFPVLHVFLSRYLLFTVPAWVLLASALPRVVGQRVGARRSWSLAALLIVGVVAVVGLPGQDQARQPLGREPDFGAAARVVQSGLRDGDGIVFAGDPLVARHAFAYLHATGVIGRPKDVLLGRPAHEIGALGATECVDTERCLAGTNRIWLVSAAKPGRDRLEGISARARRLLLADFDRERVSAANNVRVFVLERTGSRVLPTGEGAGAEAG